MVGISVYVLLFSLSVYIFVMRANMFDKASAFILGFSISYSILSFYIYGDYNPHYLIYLLAPNAFYFWGKHIIRCCSTKMAVINYLLFVFFFFALNTYILTVQDIVDVGLINPYRGLLRSGDTDVTMPATLFGLNVSLGLVGLAIAFIIPRSLRTIKTYLFVAISILSLLTNIHLINRTGLIVFVISTLSIFLFTLRAKHNPGKTLVLLMLFVVLTFLFYSIIVNNSELQDAYIQREQSSGESISGFSDRGWRWIDSLGRLFTYPLGWRGMVTYNYAHNFWLDVAMSCGILPFTFLFLATWHSFTITWKLVKKNKDYVVLAFLGLSVCSFLTSFVEPVMIGFDVYFYLYCMLWGMQYEYLMCNIYG